MMLYVEGCVQFLHDAHVLNCMQQSCTVLQMSSRTVKLTGPYKIPDALYNLLKYNDIHF